MKSIKKSGASGLIVVAVVVGPLAMADDSSGWYMGANVGQSRATIDDPRIRSNLLEGGFTSSLITDDDRDTAYKIYGGYQINRNFALEGGYFNLGKFGYTANTVPEGTLTSTIKLQGLNLDLVGILPITEKFSAFGRVGVNHAKARDTFVGSGAVRVTDPNPSRRDTNIKFGAGLQYAFTDSLALRAEVERYRIDDAIGNKGDIDHVSLGLAYRFGAKTPSPAPRASAPEILAAAPPPPAPEPPPPAPSVAVVPTKVKFSADSLFGFNKSTVTPTGKQALDQFSADLKGTSFDIITVTGHTDRIGAHAYNMRLSTGRAEAVKNYLVDSAAVPADKIETKGVNSAEPVTKPGDCKGRKPTPALIACLQPDRRVEVEVFGTR